MRQILTVMKVRNRTSFCIFIYVPPFEKAAVSSYPKFFRGEKKTRKILTYSSKSLKALNLLRLLKIQLSPTKEHASVYVLGDPQNNPSREHYKNLSSKELSGVTGHLGEMVPGSLTV